MYCNMKRKELLTMWLIMPVQKMICCEICIITQGILCGVWERVLNVDVVYTVSLLEGFGGCCCMYFELAPYPWFKVWWSVVIMNRQNWCVLLFILDCWNCSNHPFLELAGKATITSCLCLGRSEVFKSLRHYSQVACVSEDWNCLRAWDVTCRHDAKVYTKVFETASVQWLSDVCSWPVLSKWKYSEEDSY